VLHILCGLVEQALFAHASRRRGREEPKDNEQDKRE
jgi:hypothetical protein